jgi:hypothetical protein
MAHHLSIIRVKYFIVSAYFSQHCMSYSHYTSCIKLVQQVCYRVSCYCFS